MSTPDQRPLELWGGVECTVNRVGDRFLSQLARNGHRTRLSDLDRFAELGLRTLRFPILWEELAHDSLGKIDWRVIDAQLAKMQELQIRPIAGLVHHGSGPRETSLIDPQFPEKLADFAQLVAERYPWIDAYTPVNEPLTTARFSGLYGHWFPHGRDGYTFVRALLNQLRGVLLSMRVIRSVNPAAVLVQTDDLGKTFSLPRLQHQADFENERRWLTWDLLCGRVDRAHPMWSYLTWLGAEENEIEFFRENSCPPDLVGINYYVTSERFLDENLRDHAPETHGGNGRDQYADVAAVRARRDGISGAESILREACERYRLPVAVTEAHLGCTREEQLRWLSEIWQAAGKLRGQGFDVRAVTAWALLGAFDWNSLLTRDDGSYESGAFDLRSETPRPTAIAGMIRSLTSSGTFQHPVLAQSGWWHRPVRLLPSVAGRFRNGCPSEDVAVEIVPDVFRDSTAAAARPILVTGGGGKLASGIIRAAELRALAYRALPHQELDIADEAAVQNAISTVQPWAVINCAGFSSADAAEEAPDACRRTHLAGTEILAQACTRAGIPLVTFSSDHVFDGAKTEPYCESDSCEARNVFGRTKIAADRAAISVSPLALVLRAGQVLAPFAESNWLRRALQQIAHGEMVEAANDLRVSVSFLPDLANAALDLLIDDERGVWHIANVGVATPFELLSEAAERLRLDLSRIRGVPDWSLRRPATRARQRALVSERGQFLGSLTEALHRFCDDLPPLTEELATAAGAR